MREHRSHGITLPSRIVSMIIVAFGGAATGVGSSSVAASGTPAAAVAPSSGCVSVDQPVGGNADASWATGCARLAAYRGRAVWSARAASGGYVLMTATVGGAAPVPALASAKPLGVSIGPGIGGHPTAIASVYTGGRYRVRAYDFVTSSVRTVLPGTSNTSTAPLYPAIAGSLVAYAPSGVVEARKARGPRVCRLGGPCAAAGRATDQRGEAGQVRSSASGHSGTGARRPRARHHVAESGRRRALLADAHPVSPRRALAACSPLHGCCERGRRRRRQPRRVLPIDRRRTRELCGRRVRLRLPREPPLHRPLGPAHTPAHPGCRAQRRVGGHRGPANMGPVVSAPGNGGQRFHRAIAALNVVTDRLHRWLAPRCIRVQLRTARGPALHGRLLPPREGRRDPWSGAIASVGSRPSGFEPRSCILNPVVGAWFRTCRTRRLHFQTRRCEHGGFTPSRI